MVNQAEQPIENNEAPVDTGNTTTDITEDFAGVNTFEDVPASPAEDITTEPSSSEGQETSEAPSSSSDAPLPADGASPVSPPGENPPQVIDDFIIGETIKQKQGEVVLDLPYTRTDTADELEAYKQRNNIP